MTSAKIQPFCRKNTIKIGCLNDKEITPRTITKRNIALKTQIVLFCSIWESNGISFNQAIED